MARRERLDLRLSEDELSRWREQALRAGMSLSGWIRATVDGSVPPARKQAPAELMPWDPPVPKKGERTIDDSVSQDPDDIARNARLARARALKEAEEKKWAPAGGKS